MQTWHTWQKSVDLEREIDRISPTRLAVYQVCLTQSEPTDPLLHFNHMYKSSYQILPFIYFAEQSNKPYFKLYNNWRVTYYMVRKQSKLQQIAI